MSNPLVIEALSKLYPARRDWKHRNVAGTWGEHPLRDDVFFVPRPTLFQPKKLWLCRFAGGVASRPRDLRPHGAKGNLSSARR